MSRLMAVMAAFCFLASAAHARDMKLTIYDDGISCPGNCDAHFVMSSADNGTKHAFDPGSSRASPAVCKAGDKCKICFGDKDDTCMTALYRGGGPPTGTFDFTPAFYSENCTRADVPAALKAQCASLDRAAARLHYTTATNCFENPDSPKCSAVIAAAKAAQDADIPKREACLKDGEAAYNRKQADPKEQRTNACNYSSMKLGGGPSKRWHLLLPAACRSGTFVDRFGLDCCSSDIRFAAANHPDCASFFPH